MSDSRRIDAPPPASQPADVWTVGKIIDWTTQHLKKNGSDTPRLDAEILLAHVRGCKRIQLYVDYNDPLTNEHRARMRDLVKRRALAEPVAYLVGHREFFSLDFRVTPDVLIPRPETETLVLELIAAAKTQARRLQAPATSDVRSAQEAGLSSATPPLTILDMCTGSGCIAIAAAVQLPAARVTAIDNSPAALAVAADNAARHRVADRVTFLEGDLFSPLDAAARFDIIVSNPPYVADGEIDALPADVRNHEPLSALRAGPRGLDFLRRIIDDAPKFLSPGGTLLLELSPEQADDLAALLHNRGYENVRVLKDPAGLSRVAVGRCAVRGN